MLSYKDSTTLSGIFDMTMDEARHVKSLGLSTEKLYRFEDIITGQSCAFVAAAITEDKLLRIDGVKRTNKQVIVHGWFVDPCSNVHFLQVDFARPTEIDYSASHQFSLFDISLLVEIEKSAGGEIVTQRVEGLINRIRKVAGDGIRFQPLQFTKDRELGLHITLFEFTVEYILSQNKIKEEFEVAATAARKAIEKLSVSQRLVVGKAIRDSNRISITASIDSAFKNALELIPTHIQDKNMFNFLSPIKSHHVTIAFFSEVMPQKVLDKIDSLLDEFNEFEELPLETSELTLVRLTKTPFCDINRQEFIDLIKPN